MMVSLMRQSPYGPEYEQLLLTAFADLPFRFPTADAGQAKLFRMKIYGYFNLLKEENLRLDLIEMTTAISLGLDNNVVVFSWKKDLWDAQMIRNVLELSEDFSEGGTGDELKVPDLLATRLTKQLALVRERRAHAANIVPPFKTGK